jgi:hypothetical protein
VDQLRPALSRVQRKHPALRTLIREEAEGRYYEADSAPEIPLRVGPHVTEDDYRRECRTELTTDFAFDQPPLRTVLLQSEVESDLVLTISYRICDGISLFTIVREVLRSLHTDEEVVPYGPITVQDTNGAYQPRQPWKRKRAVGFVNGLLRLVPSLGNVTFLDSDAPFRLKDLRLYVHSFRMGAIGLVTYTLNGEIRFYCISDEKCMTRSQMDALKREIMALLRAREQDDGYEASSVLRAVLNNRIITEEGI